jgi:hypothetical protein
MSDYFGKRQKPEAQFDRRSAGEDTTLAPDVAPWRHREEHKALIHEEQNSCKSVLVNNRLTLFEPRSH